MIESAPIVRCRGVGKRFAGVQALRGVDLDIREGEILALIGANGAGKSTLMKILAGVIEHDSGEVHVDGVATRLRGVREAMRAGIALVHQELNLAENLDIASNIALGREPNRWGFLRGRDLNRQAREWMDRVGLEISADHAVESLSIGHRQMVEVAKALSMDARVLILDEPTSSLSMVETRRLLGLIRTLADQGVAVVYITHRLDEVMRCADRAVVLRDGAVTAEFSKTALNRDALVQAMVGTIRQVALAETALSDGAASARGQAAATVRLQVRGLRTMAHPSESIDLSIRKGEIVGLAGIVGAGRTEVLRSIFGIDRRLAGSVEIDGRALRGGRPAHATRAGIALVPEDRQRDGLFAEDSLCVNASIVRIARESMAGFIRTSAERAGVSRMIDLTRISPVRQERMARLFSGGNQQKIVLSKWLMSDPTVFLLDEPSRGVDIGARAEIHALIRESANRGAAVLCAVSDIEELLLLCDRIIVMRDGRITGELSAQDATEESITRLAVHEREECAA